MAEERDSVFFRRIWSYFGPKLVLKWEKFDYRKVGANYGQNMVHKLVIKWEKFDHRKVVAKYGKNMAHKLGKFWARFAPALCVGNVEENCDLEQVTIYVYYADK